MKEISLNSLDDLPRYMMGQYMNEKARERNEGWGVDLIKIFPSLITIKTPTILGSFSWSSLPIKHKWIMEQHAYNFGGGWITPGDIARDYLALKYPNRRMRITTSQYQACVADRRQPPLYCKPCELDDAVYMDLKSAYWSIVRAVGWDVNYNPEKFLGVNSDVEDFPYPDVKLARNCLVSVGLPSAMRMWTGEQLTFVKKPNRFVNLVLWRLVMDVLNGVAWEMIQAGAVYVYTDGFILPRDRVGHASEVARSWGLPIGIKHAGKATVLAPAAYEFPKYKTRAFLRYRKVQTDKVYNPNVRWLKPRFYKFALRYEEW